MSIANTIIRQIRKPLGAVFGVVRRLERYLGPDDDWIEDDRRHFYEAADRFLRPLGRPTIAEKGPADYVTTADASDDEVEIALTAAGFQRNLLSTRKYREHHDGGRQWAVGSYVLDHPDTDWQLHVYLFEAWTTGTDVYAHKETSVRDPYGHVTDPQTHGDPDGYVRSALADQNIDHNSRDHL